MKISGQDQHPHENDQEDNGARPAPDTDQRTRGEHGDIRDEIERAVAAQNADSLPELQALAERVMRHRNQRPRDEFCGLSPEQMSRILYDPFDSPQFVTFSDNFPKPSAPLAFALISLLADACGDDGLKATAKGYLPAKFCRDAAIAALGEEGVKEMTFGSEVRKELDFRELHIVRLVAQMAGLIRKYRGRFLRTKKCEKLLSASSHGKLYLQLLTAYVRKFNWGYSDGYDDHYLIQEAFLFSLFLIHRFGDEFRSPVFYEEKFLQAFPTVLDEVKDPVYGSKEDQVRNCYSLRTMERFARFFGLIELDGNYPGFVRRSYKMKKSALLDQLINFHV